MNRHPDIIGDYPGRPETFTVAQPQHPRTAQGGVWVGWRQAEPWEAVVVQRAWARLLELDAESVRTG